MCETLLLPLRHPLFLNTYCWLTYNSSFISFSSQMLTCYNSRFQQSEQMRGGSFGSRDAEPCLLRLHDIPETPEDHFLQPLNLSQVLFVLYLHFDETSHRLTNEARAAALLSLMGCFHTLHNTRIMATTTQQIVKKNTWPESCKCPLQVHIIFVLLRQC